MTTYIAEIAGRDSIAAVHKIIREKSANVIVPTIVYTGTEYGDFSSYLRSINYLIECGNRYGVSVKETVVLRDEFLWNQICVRYQNLIFSRFGFFTPCIMCHLFTHLLRIPIYFETGSAGIITGERYSHDGKIKINQQHETIQCFQNLFKRHGITLVQPIIHEGSIDAINAEIKDYPYIECINGVKCILSGNLTGWSLSDSAHFLALKQYLDCFIVPVGDYLVESYAMNKRINFETLDLIIRSCFNV